MSRVRRQTWSNIAARSASVSATISPLMLTLSRLAPAGSIFEMAPSASRKMFFCSLSHSMLPPVALSATSIFVSLVRRFVDQRLAFFSKRAR